MKNLLVLGIAALATVFTAPAAIAQLVINEVDYDQINTDFDEFVELRNNSDCPVDLTNLALVFINGANNVEYLRVALSGAGSSIGPGQYLVVGSGTVVPLLPAGVLHVTFIGASNNIQNGSPDGIAIVDTAALTVIDSLSYEGAMTAATITGFPGTYNLVSGTVLPAAIADSNATPASFSRIPDGTDTNDDISDWALVTTPTPGTSNGGTSQALRPCCGTSDFNGDGDFGTDADIEAFFACLGGNCCATCGTSDFNADGDFGTDADIEAFFRVLGGGPC